MVWLRVTFFLLVAVANVAGASRQSTNVLYDALTTKGVKLSDGTVIKLPLSTLSDEACCDQQQVLEEVAGKIPYEEFVRNSRTARFRIQLKSVKDASGNRTGQTVDVWFVAYGKLQAIEDNELLEELVKLNRKNAKEQDADRNRRLTDDELTERDIQAIEDEDQLVECYGLFDGPLLKKVQVSGVTRSVLARGNGSTLAAMALDERFAGDPEFPNQWRSIKRNEAGEAVMESAQPYAGFGGYAKVTELVAPQGAMLVEIHVAFDEPQGWFGGANLLRSKLPLVIQDNVRAFRKKLMNIAESSD